ncbi:UNVERIFIED_ORG: hypothetical protein J3D58_003044 [Paenarthrobacter nicotinovorans]
MAVAENKKHSRCGLRGCHRADNSTTGDHRRLPVDGRLRVVGRPTVLSTRVGHELGRQLRPARPGHPWPEEIQETLLNRFSKDKGLVHLTLVDQIVVEVSADVELPPRHLYSRGGRVVHTGGQVEPPHSSKPAGF